MCESLRSASATLVPWVSQAVKVWLVTATHRKCTDKLFRWRIYRAEASDDAISYVKSLGYCLDDFDLAAELLADEPLAAKAAAVGLERL